MKLEDLGWSAEFAVQIDDPSLRAARVATVHAVRLDLLTADGPRRASLRSGAFDSALGGIAVGDWVAIADAGGTDVVVERVLARKTAFLRQAAGERTEPQAIAANIDRVFIVTSCGDGTDTDFNLRRVERYLVAIAAGGAAAEIVLTKADLATDLEPLLAAARALAPAFATSAKTGLGLDELQARIAPGVTGALVGSSGVGKSALVNRLLGHEAQLEGAVRSYDGRGRHTTTRRELFVLPSGGLLIDTPGMRELKPWLGEGNIDAFDDVMEIAGGCRFGDCLHDAEPGCAVREAIASGAIASERVASWQKLTRESAAAVRRWQSGRRSR